MTKQLSWTIWLNRIRVTDLRLASDGRDHDVTTTNLSFTCTVSPGQRQNYPPKRANCLHDRWRTLAQYSGSSFPRIGCRQTRKKTAYWIVTSELELKDKVYEWLWEELTDTAGTGMRHAKRTLWTRVPHCVLCHFFCVTADNITPPFQLANIQIGVKYSEEDAL